MKFAYSPKDDTFTITFRRVSADDYPYTADDFEVVVDDQDALAQITIKNAGRFVAQLLSMGVTAKEGTAAPRLKSGMVWYDTDSSMISAYGYDAENEILDLAFHRTGDYRYYDVPNEVFQQLHSASSKGSYIRDLIVDQYRWEKKGRRSRR
jgi:hypothetical protein